MINYLPPSENNNWLRQALASDEIFIIEPPTASGQLCAITMPKFHQRASAVHNAPIGRVENGETETTCPGAQVCAEEQEYLHHR